MTHAEYVRNKTIRTNSLFICNPDSSSFYVINNELLSPEQMNERYPVTGRLQNWKEKHYWKGENPDKRNLWQNE